MSQLSRAVPGSKVFFPGFLLWAASNLLLAVSYFLPLPMRTLWLLGSVAKGPKFQPQTIKMSFQKLVLI
jgi:hypothetical protein